VTAVTAANYFLTVLAPIADDSDSRLRHLEALEKKLEKLRMAERSPFERCPALHMARFVVIDELPLQLGDSRREFLSRNYLLFIAELSGDLDDFLDELYENAGALVRSIFRHCAGFPRVLKEARDGESGAARVRFRSVYFRRFLRRHEVKTLIPFAGVPDVGVRDIKRAIETQSSLARFVAEHPPRKSDQEIYDDWRKHWTP
jgi:hypothetical protein